MQEDTIQLSCKGLASLMGCEWTVPACRCQSTHARKQLSSGAWTVGRTLPEVSHQRQILGLINLLVLTRFVP